MLTFASHCRQGGGYVLSSVERILEGEHFVLIVEYCIQFDFETTHVGLSILHSRTLLAMKQSPLR